MTLTVTSDGATLRPATDAELGTLSGGAAVSPTPNPTAAVGPGSIGAIEETDVLAAVPLTSATPATAGSKAYICGDLAAKALASGGLFKAPAGCVLPFGVMEALVAKAGKSDIVASSVAAAEGAAAASDYANLDAACESIRSALKGIEIPPEVCASIASSFESAGFIAVRSSANVEDLAGMSAAGLYDSVLGVDASNPAEISSAVKEVYASLFSRRAVLARHAAGVVQSTARMAVLMQTMVPSEVSFVLHTESTQSDTPGTCLTAEVAVGLGETLASGTRGTPWRLEVDKTTGLTSTTAFASIGTALVMDAGGSSVKTRTVDYSSNALSVDPAARAALGAKLRDAGVALETAYGSAQDVEGGIVDGEVYIVQSRPQPQ